MEYIEKIKKKLCDELEEYAMKSKLTMQDLEPLQLMTDIVKNLGKIEMLEDDGDYSEARGMRGGRSYMGGSSYDDDMMYSERRGRGRNAKRDSMGRYSSEDGSSYDDYSEARMDRRYSRDDAKDHILNKMGEMMTSADEEQRQIIKDAMRKIERM
jgi:hypothetical protein